MGARIPRGKGALYGDFSSIELHWKRLLSSVVCWPFAKWCLPWPTVPLVQRLSCPRGTVVSVSDYEAKRPRFESSLWRKIFWRQCGLLSEFFDLLFWRMLQVPSGKRCRMLRSNRFMRSNHGWAKSTWKSTPTTDTGDTLLYTNCRESRLVEVYKSGQK